MTAVRGRISKSGRLSIPAAFRKAVGLEQGGDVVVELDGHEIRIRSVDEVITHAQALTRRLIGGKPDELVFTRGATEGINLVARTLPKEGRNRVLLSQL